MIRIIEDFKDLTEHVAHARDWEIAKFPLPQA
jgi:hypothetical protein